MLSIFSIILPLFLLIGLGFLAVKTQIVKPDMLPGIGGLVLYFTLPATIFSAISRIQFDEVIEPPFILAYCLVSVLTFSTGMAINHWLLKQDILGGAVRALGMSIPNSIFIGFPVLLLTLPDVATIAFVMAVLVENLLTLPMALILLAYGMGKSSTTVDVHPLALIAQRMVKNPILWAIVAGVVASLLNLQLPKPLMQTLDLLARASAALALLFIGGTLASSQLRGKSQGIGWVVAGKLVLMPVVAVAVIGLLPDFNADLQKALVIIAAVPMLAIYPILCESAGYRVFCANALLVTTVLGFFSLALVLHFVGIA